MATRYTYKPLQKDIKEIRLLVVEPGKPWDTIHAELEHVYFSEDRFVYFDQREAKYETCSYCWGPPSAVEDVFVGHHMLSVPQSATTVIRRMRYPDRIRILWIDAVCINQGDPVERGHQVGLMSEVFTHTWRNLAWLGDEDENTGPVLDALETLIAEVREDADDFRSFREMLYDEEGRPKFSHSAIRAQRELRLVASLFARTWFSRRWILQEATLPPETLAFIGRYEQRLTDVLSISLWVSYKSAHIDQDTIDAFQPAITMASYASEHSPWCVRWSRRHLTNALVGADTFQASDPRDLVYGILGLTRSPTLLRPDYSASVIEVYRDAIKAAIAESGWLTLLAGLRPRSEDDRDRPSWIVQLDRKFDRSYDSHHFAQTFRACDDRLVEHIRVRRDDSDDPWLLTLSGFTLATITRHTNLMSGHLDGYRAALSMCGLQISPSEAHHSLRGLCFALTAGTNYLLERANEETYQDFCAYHDYVAVNGCDPPSLRDPATEGKSAARFREAMFLASKNSGLFVTSSGSYGLGAQRIQVGDLICVLDGGECPVILRLKPGGTEYRWIGFCYISDDDLMFGDIARKFAAEGKPYETFSIR